MTKISKNVRSRDQFKKYETETRSLRDQDRDRQQKAETETLKIGLKTFITATYLCEAGFSDVASIKTKFRNRLNVCSDIRLA